MKKHSKRQHKSKRISVEEAVVAVRPEPELVGTPEMTPSETSERPLQKSSLGTPEVIPVIGATTAIKRPTPRRNDDPKGQVIEKMPLHGTHVSLSTVVIAATLVLILIGLSILLTGAFLWHLNTQTVAIESNDGEKKGGIPDPQKGPEVKPPLKRLRLVPLDDKTIDEGEELRLAVVLDEVPNPRLTQRFSVGPEAPAGVRIDSVSGIITWTPTEEQGPGDYSFPITVLEVLPGDSHGSLSEPVVCRVAVREVNSPPRVESKDEFVANAGTELKIIPIATDPDFPTNALLFTIRGAPEGATINPRTGELNWRVPDTYDEVDVDLAIVVSDDGKPPLEDERIVRVRVLPKVKPPPVKPPPLIPVDRVGEVIENSLKMRFVFVPAGTFDMGSPFSEEERGESERLHKVKLTKGFFIGIHDVTQWEYEQVMGHNPSYFSAKGGGKSVIGVRDTARFPVDNVSWNDAVEFCHRLSEDDRWKYRLPTEAEWEYACRAQKRTAFYFGNALNGDRANCNGNDPFGMNQKGKFLKRTAQVGSYPPNGFGLFDMHGNVWEWCNDWYADYDFEGVDPKGPGLGDLRVIRGGSWYDSAHHCRAAKRVRSPPATKSNEFGFRVICEK